MVLPTTFSHLNQLQAKVLTTSGSKNKIVNEMTKTMAPESQQSEFSQIVLLVCLSKPRKLFN